MSMGVRVVAQKRGSSALYKTLWPVGCSHDHICVFFNLLGNAKIEEENLDSKELGNVIACYCHEKD